MDEGFLKIYRKVRDNWIYKRSEYFQIWIEMLFCANYIREPKKILIDGQIIIINYGEFIFGRMSWSKRLNISESILRGLIKKLIADEMIEETKQYSKCTVYKIKNFSKYNQQNDQQACTDNTIFKSIDDHQSDQQMTSNRPAGDHIQEIKEIIRKNYYLEIENFRQRYSDFLDSLDEYFEILRTTRVSGKISDSVVYKVYQEMNKYPVIVVKYAVLTIIHKSALQSKKENYLYGILRNTKAEDAAEMVKKWEAANQTVQAQPNSEYMRLKKVVSSGC